MWVSFLAANEINFFSYLDLLGDTTCLKITVIYEVEL